MRQCGCSIDHRAHRRFSYKFLCIIFQTFCTMLIKEDVSTLNSKELDRTIKEIVHNFVKRPHGEYDSAARTGLKEYGKGAIFIEPFDPFVESDRTEPIQYVPLSEVLMEKIPDLRQNVEENNFETHWICVFCVYATSDRSTSGISVVRIPYSKEFTLDLRDAQPVDLKALKGELMNKKPAKQKTDLDDIMASHLESLYESMTGDELDIFEQKCKVCHRKVKKMMQCSKCKSVYYCDKDCQLRDWAAHKKVCIKL